ncbi:MAG TPA: hypothetical protein VGR47_06025 [Terracidiphilus sp.]|nr:hypothetical protein [Terracidiphilus sp.]
MPITVDDPGAASAGPNAGSDAFEAFDAEYRRQLAQQDAARPQVQGASLPAVFAAASTLDPDAEARAQMLAQATGLGVGTVRRDPAAAGRMAQIFDFGQRDLALTSPVLARQFQDPNFAAVAHDDLDSLSRIEQGASAARAGTGVAGEANSFLANTDLALVDAVKPFVDAAGVAAQGGWESAKALLQPTSWGQVGSELSDIWLTPRTFAVQRLTGKVEDYYARQVIPGQPRYVTDQSTGQPVPNPAYRWWGRPLVNALERVPAQMATFYATGKLGGMVGEASAGEALPEAGRLAGAIAPGAEAESKTVPLLLGTQAAQSTYAQARARGADQKTALLAALASGVSNYALMAKVPGPVPTTSVPGALGQWAARSVAVGTGMTLANNAVARTYDPGQPMWEGLPESILTMAAFEGPGALGQVADAAAASRLRTRSPEAFQRFANAVTEGDESVRVPAQNFVSYFAGKKVDPAAVANELGVSNLEEAHAAGSDLEIPRGAWIGKLAPEDQKGLLPDVVDPTTGLTQRQFRGYRQELEDLGSDGSLAKLAQEYAQADAETQATPEWKQVYSDLKQRYVDAGETETAADGYATLQANAIANLAKGAGMKPDELLAMHNPRLVAGEAPETAGEGAAALHQQAIENIRSVVEAGRQTGDARQKAVIGPAEPWLIDAAAEHGLDLAGHSHVIDGSAVRHVLTRHSDRKIELSRGQLPVGDADFEQIPDMVASPDAVVFGTKTRGKRDQVGYIKRQADGSTLHLEEVRTGKKELAAVSMRKYPAARDFDSIAETLPSNARGDGGNKPILVLNPSADKGADGGEVLHQAARADGGGASRKARNLEAAQVQGELLKGGAGRAEPEGPRGWFRMRPDGSYELGKTPVGDLSTFIHEPAHAYLEMFRELTQREGASGPLKDDFRKLTEWLGTTPEEAYKNGFTREQHEQWARANEQYVREGKAPTAGLRRAFHNFAVWMSSIYRRANGLGVELSPEIRGVMDRLYAGEDAVDRAAQGVPERLFASPEEAGWTDIEYKAYAEARGIAEDKARSQVAAELNAAAERERTEQWREERNNVRDALTEQIDARPEYAAIRSLRRGKTDLGTDLTLNREALVRQFGEERVKALQQLHRGLYRNEGGTDAENAAEMLGFNSGEEMMQALEAAPRRAQAIDAATRSYMTEKYGDVRYDGSLDDKARLALENDDQARNLYGEVKALRARVAVLEKRAADTKAAMASITLEPLERYQEAARRMIEQKAIADLQPHRYLDASRKFSREAFDALRKGNVTRAAEAKNKELLNHFLFREASAARDYAEKFEKYATVVQRPTTQQKLGLADESVKRDGEVGDYRDQFNWLLARHRLGSEMQPPERTLREWAADMYDQGKEPAIADGVLKGDRARFADWRSIPLSEVRDLHDALENIRHLASQEYKVFVDGRSREIEQMAKELDEGIRANMPATPEKVFEKEPGFLRGLAHSIDVQNSRMEFLIDKWDGGERGPWRRYVWEPYQNAKGDELGLQADVTKALNDAVEREAERHGLRLTEKVAVDGIPSTEDNLTRKQLVSMALNMGNESNLDRLEKTFDFYHWDRAAIRRVGGMLKPEEWRFVQGVWDALKPWGERMNAMEKRLTGLPPKMVEVKPFKVALNDGTEMDLAGGYYPVHYDPRYVAKGYEEEATKSARNLMERGYGRPTTSRNYTKARTGSAGPLLMDYERTLTDHIAKVSKDLSHREFMLNTVRILLHPRVQKALREAQGRGADQDGMGWLRATVNDRNGSIDGGPNDIRPYLMKLRSNLVKASLVFKGSTALLQFGHFSRIMKFTNPKSYTQAMVDFWKNPAEMTRTIRELSPNQMRFRGENLTRDYAAMFREISDKRGIMASLERVGYAPLMYVDHALSFPLWLSVYNDALLKNGPEMDEGESHKIAMHSADSAVQMGMGTGTTGDLPPIMRSPDLFKQFETTLFGFENLNYNIMRHKVGGDAAREWRRGNRGGAAVGLTYGAAMAFFVPAIISAYTRGDGPKDGENWGLWAAKRSLFFAGGTVPLVKDVLALAEYGSDRSTNPMMGLVGKVIDDLRRSGREGETDWTGFGIDALEGLGDRFGVPGTAQAAHTLRYAHRASQGKVENPSVYGAVVGGR